jgi:predicted ATPase/DNA-binding winged helix-turn-helix (wHTH) protein
MNYPNSEITGAPPQSQSVNDSNDSEIVLAFGPFRLDPVRHALWEAGKPLRVGSRALEILLALVERPGEIVGKIELLTRVWPNSVIDDGALRVHITALRKILGDRKSGVRYIENISGQGYRFAAPVRRLHQIAKFTAAAEVGSMSYRADNLPALLTKMVGRSQVLSELAVRVPQRRFVTITGPGGIGKTTLALSVAQTLAPSYPHGVCFVDLALLTEPRQVSGALATALDLGTLEADPLPGVLAFLRDKSILVLLDNCEHLIEVVARLAEQLLTDAVGVHVLATSREPLRAKGEFLHRLAPLAMPLGDGAMTRVEAMSVPAVQLFVERAEADSDTFELNDAEVPLIVEICRRLDGNPLAIELAAAHVELLGLRGLAFRLDEGLHLSIRGRRTAVPRHKTLRATLDWSYELLSPAEQAILRRLAVFVGRFDLPSACAVAAEEAVDAPGVFEGLVNLAAKSLIAVDVTCEKVLYYRMLETQRAYALEKLRGSKELSKTQHRHAEMWRTLGAAEIRAQLGADWFTACGPRIDDLRAALRWCFSTEGTASVGTRLSLTSSWFEFVLAAEYGGNRELAQRAAHIRPASEAELCRELDVVLAEVRPRLKGPVQQLTVAQQLADVGSKRRTALWGLWFERLILRDCRVAINISECFQGRSIPDPDVAMTAIDQILTVAHHYAGCQSRARRYAERVLRGSGPNALVAAGESLQPWHARTMLSRILWLQGFADQAIRTTHEGVAEALAADRPHLLCTTLIDAVIVTLWCGDLGEAARYQTILREYSAAHSFEYYQHWSNCLDTVLAVSHGRIAVEPDLKLSDDPLSGSQYWDVLGTTSEELVSTCSISRAEHGRGGCYTPEILRVKGERFLKERGCAAAAEAEAQFERALLTARSQGALAWELRAAMSLARLWRAQQRIGPAHDLLSGIYGRFTEGFATADLIAAKALLESLANAP